MYHPARRGVVDREPAMSTTVTVVAPFQVVDAGTVYESCDGFEPDD